MTKQSKELLHRLTEVAMTEGWSVQKYKSMIGIFKSKSYAEQLAMVRGLEGKNAF